MGWSGAYDIEAFNLTKKDEWGPSESILDFNQDDNLQGKLNEYTVRMQSGDIIAIIAKGYHITKV